MFTKPAFALLGNYWRAIALAQLARGVAVQLQRTGGILLALTGVCLGSVRWVHSCGTLPGIAQQGCSRGAAQPVRCRCHSKGPLVTSVDKEYCTSGRSRAPLPCKDIFSTACLYNGASIRNIFYRHSERTCIRPSIYNVVSA